MTTRATCSCNPPRYSWQRGMPDGARKPYWGWFSHETGILMHPGHCPKICEDCGDALLPDGKTKPREAGDA